MPETSEGTKVFIDATVLKLVDDSVPPAMSRTAWVNYLLQVAVTKVPRLND